MSMPAGSSAAISLYMEGEPLPGVAGFTIDDDIPPIQIYSDSYCPWTGHIQSSLKGFLDGRRGPAASAYSSISPFNEPYGYEMNSWGSSPGIQFEADLPGFGEIYATLITLWDHSTLFEVPVDTLYIWKAGAPGGELVGEHADAGGPYQLAEGESIAFDATASTETWMYDDGEGGYEYYTMPVGDSLSLTYWSIGGVDIAFGLNPTISYDTIVDGLQLGAGVYDLTVSVDGYLASTTIEILPEPSSVILLVLGSLLVWKRR